MSDEFPLGKKFYVMRHAETDDNKEKIASGTLRNPRLTVGGIREAEGIRGLLANLEPQISEIITSEVKRTKETAKIITNCDELRILPIVSDFRINERDYGAGEGMNEVDRRKAKKAGVLIKGEESKDSVRDRTMSSIYSHLSLGKVPLFITHAGNISRLLGVALGGEGAVEKIKKYADSINKGYIIGNCVVYEFITPNKKGGDWQVNELSLGGDKKIERVSVNNQVKSFSRINTSVSNSGIRI